MRFPPRLKPGIPTQDQGWGPRFSSPRSTTLLPFLFGLTTASMIAVEGREVRRPGRPRLRGRTARISPGWYPPLCSWMIALIGGLSTSTTSLFQARVSTSQRLHAFQPRPGHLLHRRPVIAFIFVGRFRAQPRAVHLHLRRADHHLYAPWMIVMALGYVPGAACVVRRGGAAGLAPPPRGGRYWFTHGWNWRACPPGSSPPSWHFFFTNLPGQFVGPLRRPRGGTDTRCPVASPSRSCFYLALLTLFPEPRAVYGPAGPRFVRRPRTPCSRRSPAMRGRGSPSPPWPAEPSPLLPRNRTAGVGPARETPTTRSCA